MRIFVVGDVNDKLIPLAAQQAYFEALKCQGGRTAMTTSTAVGDSHHSLGATGQHAVGWCIDGRTMKSWLAWARTRRPTSLKRVFTETLSWFPAVATG